VLKQRFLRYVLGLVLTVVFVGYASNRIAIAFIDALENQAYDFRLQLTLPDQVDKKVVIIDIDEKSLAEIGHWPWERNVLARILDNLFDYYHVKALGFDIVFSEKDEDPSDQYLVELANSPLRDQPVFQAIYNKAAPDMHRDDQLARALANRNTIMGVVFYDNEAELKKGQLPPALPQFSQDIVDSFDFSRAIGYTANLPVLQQSAYDGGFFDNPQLDNDGVFRRVPLLQAYSGQLYQSLALAVARAYLGDNNAIKLQYQTIDNRNSLEWIHVGQFAVPVDESAGVLVPYIGTNHSFDYIPATDILHKRLPADALAGKAALFGTSAAGLLDLRTTPLEKAYPGVEVHANIIQGILDQTIMHKPEYILGFEILLLLVLGLTLTFILPALSPLWNSVSILTAISLMLALNMYAWTVWQIVLPIAAPILLVLLLYILNMTLGFFIESRGKRHLTHLFGQYVPPELVDEMSRNMNEINLDGEIRNMSVLFTDVRGFTTISENMEPKELTRFINAFLTPLTRIIHTNRGTIDKYMGDAIMAFWGAPLKDQLHARHALNAAVEMIAELNSLRESFKKEGWPEIRIGVGVNSGPMNVGNKGSEFRVDYTVLGDAVNLGSRLESLTKQYGVDIIIGPNTHHEVPEFEYRELDLVRVKGKDKPVTIYEPIGLVENVDKAVRTQIKRFHHALQLYRAQKWDDAEQEIFQLHQAEPERKIYKIYLDRIAWFRQNPPETNWDGAFTQTSK
jgi:adenylate cyclase